MIRNQQPEEKVVQYNSRERTSILIVEDDPIYLKYLMYLLNKMNINVINASSAEMAIDLMQDRIVSCMLIDNDLGPGINGIKLMKTFRQQSRFKDTFIIAMTPFSVGCGGGEKLLKMGFTDCLAKPFTFEYFKDFLARYVTI
jgi:DNA-binding response OmpR family regulator